MPTRKAAKTKSTTKKARKSPKGPTPAITIKLNAKQRAQLKRLTDGRVDAQTIQLSSDSSNIEQFLDSLARLATTERRAAPTKLAPPPKNTWWV